ncbi:MAG: RNA-binding protein, partial [Campylobacterales bacterium]|nr:RNA-binding protein [Campylobacterales bacterium]
MQIYVGNLSYRTTEESLKNLFEQYGEVASAKIITDRETGRSKGFGFVTMNDGAAALEAIDSLNGKDFDGRTFRINEAKPREERPRRQ